MDFMKAELEEFRIGDGIDVWVVRPGTVPGHHEGRAFVKIVDNGGMPFVKHAVNGLGGFVSLLMGVTIYVDEGVFGPVRRRLARQSGPIGLTLEVAIEPLHHFVATIGIRNGIDENDELFADVADVRLVGDGESIGEFEHSFCGTGFIGMQASVEVVDRP